MRRECGIGGTGIVGMLTDYGGLIVNGNRIALDARTRIADTRGAVDAGSLRIGQSLTVEARRKGGGACSSTGWKSPTPSPGSPSAYRRAGRAARGS